ncbi:DUF397 domain-containing protein [Actinacidiphila sp. bgisy144]|uniref:DUF397 domain-containing protein n=1 Tax=Actinacidiphila sp. bgisy144 TaxID=3413791 RepID=UPI003EBECC0B
MYDNGVRADSIVDARWVKSTASAPKGDCVEVAKLANGDVAVRNSRHTKGPALVYTRSEFRAFVAGARAGDFDTMTD